MRVSLRTIAETAGVNVATVSRALRGLASVEPATRERICAIAQNLGYVRDPLLASALAFARRADKPVYRETIAFLAAVPPAHYPRFPWLARIRAGAAGRAAELGYGLECLRTPTQPREQQALGRQLRSRGIRGCVICPVSPVAEWEPFTLDMDWSHLSGIEIGHALISPALPRIARNLADDLAGLFRELHARGYRRIGLAVSRKDEESRRWAVHSSGLLFADTTPGVRVFSLFKDEPGYTATAFRRWLTRRKPDALVINGPGVMDWLAETARDVPGDIGVCRIDCVDGCRETGLQTSYEAMGRMSVNQLTSSLERGEPALAGDPVLRPVLSIPSLWHEGATLRPRCPRGKAGS